jgi:hypothetical protein
MGLLLSSQLGLGFVVIDFHLALTVLALISSSAASWIASQQIRRMVS